MDTSNENALLPDSLIDVWATFYTPSWVGDGDGKNGNDSWLYLLVSIKTTDGTVYKGETHVRDSSPVDKGNSISPHIPIPGMEKINYNNIAEVSFDVRYIKEDYVIDMRQDVWKVRAELVLRFPNERYLSTGYNDEKGPKTLEFTDVLHNWSPKPNPRLRTQLIPYITITGAGKD